jgi:hypothetical protein
MIKEENDLFLLYETISTLLLESAVNDENSESRQPVSETRIDAGIFQLQSRFFWYDELRRKYKEKIVAYKVKSGSTTYLKSCFDPVSPDGIQMSLSHTHSTVPARLEVMPSQQKMTNVRPRF